MANACCTLLRPEPARRQPQHSGVPQQRATLSGLICSICSIDGQAFGQFQGWVVYDQAMHTRTLAHLKDFLPRGLSRLDSDRSTPAAARLSPLVRAPRLCRRRATAAANLFSPPRLVTISLYRGPLTCAPACVFTAQRAWRLFALV